MAAITVPGTLTEYYYVAFCRAEWSFFHNRFYTPMEFLLYPRRKVGELCPPQNPLFKFFDNLLKQVMMCVKTKPDRLPAHRSVLLPLKGPKTQLAMYRQCISATNLSKHELVYRRE